jgi:acetolactate synthase I/II/III large subunit
MADLVSGHLAMQAVARAGVQHLFTLSGAHIFPLYDGCRHEGIALWDVRHEQTAVFAAEGLAKLTGRPQVAAVTAGPGVTNSISALATAQANGSPVLLLGGRAAEVTWGTGTLQEIDQLPFTAPLTKRAHTTKDPAQVAADVGDALRLAATPHRGPVFVDLPMDVIFTPASADTVPDWTEPESCALDAEAVAGAAALLRQAQRPVVIGGTDVWMNGAHEELRLLVETLHAPVLQNGMGRGCVPADHALAISRARGTAFKQADVVLVVGTPLDFRLGFGRFGSATVIHVADHPDGLASHLELGAGVSGDLRAVLTALAEATGGPAGDAAAARADWVRTVTDVEQAKRTEETGLLASDADPIHPARVYGELRRALDRDAVVIGDGGDFVSYGGKYLDSFTAGRWLDPGPYGCLGIGPGYAMAARIAHPGAQVVLLWGDGAAGFSLADVESLARLGLPVVIVCGNNGIWALEKHPMRAMYGGWDVAADLQPGLRYDEVVRALGGAGETVAAPGDIGPALQRAFDAGVPYLVNVITDPEVAYPRSSL